MVFDEKLIEERRLKSFHIFIATFIGQIASEGYINQGAINYIGKKIANSLVIYLRYIYSEKITSIKENLEGAEEIFNLLIKELDPFGKYEIIRNEEMKTLRVRIESSSCKYCPKGVGQSEIPGNLCLFPILIASVIDGLSPLRCRFITKLKKENSTCYFDINFGNKDTK